MAHEATPPSPREGAARAEEPQRSAGGSTGSDRAGSSLVRGLLLCVIGLLLDGPALGAVLLGRVHGPDLLWVLLAHIAASAAAAFGLMEVSPAAMQSPRRIGVGSLLGLCFLMPVFSNLGLLGGLLAERYLPRKEPPPEWLTVEFPALPQAPAAIAGRPGYADGAISASLRYAPDRERRLSAVMAARRLRDRGDCRVLRLALTSPIEDVRLLAYSILDRREQSFNALLKRLDALLNETTGEPSRSRIRKRIAQVNLEMITLGLASGDVEGYLLAEALRHVEAALQVEPQDRESHFLLGIIALRQGDVEAAERALLKAQELGTARTAVLPPLAEIAFRRQRFKAVSTYLRALHPIYVRTKPQLSGLAAHWVQEEE